MVMGIVRTEGQGSVGLPRVGNTQCTMYTWGHSEVVKARSDSEWIAKSSVRSGKGRKKWYLR